MYQTYSMGAPGRTALYTRNGRTQDYSIWKPIYQLSSQSQAFPLVFRIFFLWYAIYLIVWIFRAGNAMVCDANGPTKRCVEAREHVLVLNLATCASVCLCLASLALWLSLWHQYTQCGRTPSNVHVLVAQHICNPREPVLVERGRSCGCSSVIVLFVVKVWCENWLTNTRTPTRSGPLSLTQPTAELPLPLSLSLDFCRRSRALQCHVLSL